MGGAHLLQESKKRSRTLVVLMAANHYSWRSFVCSETIALNTKLYSLAAASLLLAECHSQPHPGAQISTPSQVARYAQTDSFGDSLPDLVVARLGSKRWRFQQPIISVRFAEKGKHLLTSYSDGTAHLSNAETGQIIRPLGRSDAHASAISMSGNLFAQVTRTGRAHVWIAPTGMEIRSFDLWPNRESRCLLGLVFLGDQRLVGCDHEDNVVVWDVETGKQMQVLLRSQRDNKEINKGAPCIPPERTGDDPQIAASPDGSIIFYFSGSGNLHRWNLIDGNYKAVRELAGNSLTCKYGMPVFTNDNKYFALPKRDGTVCIYLVSDLDKVRSVGTASAEEGVSALCFSEDCKLLAITTPGQVIKVFDLATGKLQREIGEVLPSCLRESPFSFGSEPKIATNSGQVAWCHHTNRIAQVWGPTLIRVWSFKTGKGNSISSSPLGATVGLAIADDGRTAYSINQDRVLRTWDLCTLKEVNRTGLPGGTSFGAFLGSGRALLHGTGGRLSVWDYYDNKQLFKTQFVETPKKFDAQDVSQGGKILYITKLPGMRQGDGQNGRLYSLETGEQYIAVPDTWASNKGATCEQLVSLIRANNGSHWVGCIAQYSEIGGLGSNGDHFQIRCKRSTKDSSVVWATEVFSFTGLCRAVSFAPDDRSILTYSLDFNSGDSWLSLLESNTGKVRCRFDIPVAIGFGDRCLHAFSPSGDLLAVPTNDGTTTLIDIRLGRAIGTLKGDQGRPCSLAFGADGRTLLTGGADGTVLIWDIHGLVLKARSTLELSASKIDAAWNELADANAVTAYRAMATLVKSPSQAVKLLRGKLKPIEPVTAAHMNKLIADLNSDKYQAREKASSELRHLGARAKAGLEKCLSNSLTLEQFRRIESLVIEIDQLQAVPSQEELQSLRAIEILETLATPEALMTLRTMANGAPGVRVTDQAADALKRRGTKKS